jgi:predicted MFS family arabinose efflux permease
MTAVGCLRRGEREAEFSVPDPEPRAVVGRERVGPMPAGPAPSAWAFRSRDFRLFMAGNWISWIGDWMDLVALNWAVLALSGSALQLGLINACRLLPVFALSMPAGILADRMDRRRLLLWLQTGTMVLTFALGALLLTRVPFLLFALVVAARAGLSAMAIPIRSALLPALVSPEALASAVASQTAVMSLSRILGPALGGALLLLVPTETVFWINGASFLPVLWTLIAVQTGSAPPPVPDRSRSAVGEALAYICGDGAVRSLLVLAIVPMIFGFPYTSMMPLFARDLLQCGPTGLGVLLAVAAAGALAGSALLSLPRFAARAGRTMVLATLVFGASLLAFTASRTFPLALGALFLTGLAGQAYRTTNRVALQGKVPDHLRGRILSIALMDRGFIPVGAVLLGAVADAAGATWAGVVMGGGCLVVTLFVVATRRDIWSL